MVAKDQGKPPWGTDSKALTSSLIRPAHLAYTSTRYTERQGGENGGGRICVPVLLAKAIFFESAFVVNSTNQWSSASGPSFNFFKPSKTACESGAARRLEDDDSEDVMLRDGVIHFVKPPSS